jgi:hypothetical protein
MIPDYLSLLGNGTDPRDGWAGWQNMPTQRDLMITKMGFKIWPNWDVKMGSDLDKNMVQVGLKLKICGFRNHVAE